jgi:hypothetical protein
VSKNGRAAAAKVTAELDIHLFPQTQSNESVTNPTSTVELQLLNLWLLRATLKGEKDGVFIIKPGHLMTVNTQYGQTSRPYVFPNIRLGLCLENAQGNYNPECLVPTVKHGGGCALIWAAMSFYSAGHVIPLYGRITANEYRDILWSRCFLRMTQVFSMTVRPYTQPAMFILRLRSMKMHFSNFPGQHNCQNMSNHYD